MSCDNNASSNKLAHYQVWIEAWLVMKPSDLPAEECLVFLEKEAPRWLKEASNGSADWTRRMHEVVACFKTAASARLILLGGKVPPSCDPCDVLSESYDARVYCACDGLFPVPRDLGASGLGSCGCKAIERMVAEGDLVSSKEGEWNSSTFFSAEYLSSAMAELALCHADMQAPPSSCSGPMQKSTWPEVRAPDRKPHPDVDLEEDTYARLYPTIEHIRLSADAKHFHATASGASLLDPGLQAAIVDSGNDILIGDYCDAATDECLTMLQKIGAGAFAFLKLCVYAGLMSDWHFNLLVAQTIQFRVIGYWRDHALPRRPQGVYGSRMISFEVHRYIDLGMTVAIVSASMATGQTMTAAEYGDVVATTLLINDLVDFRGDTWRNQRENVVLRGVRGSLCTYLDDLLTKCLRGAGMLVSRDKVFALMVMCFCNWMLLSSGHKVYETVKGVHPIEGDLPCRYFSKDNGTYEKLLTALEPYGTLGEGGPRVTMKRKDLQLLYAVHRQETGNHLRWLADVVRIVLHPDILRQLVDVVHYPWTGEVGSVNYCA